MEQPPQPICNVPLPNVPAQCSLKVPKEEDNDAMRLWRATVHPLDNVGEPSSAEWGRFVRANELPLGFPLSVYNNPPKWILLEYPNPGDVRNPNIAQWIPGKKYEYGWSKINSGEVADPIPAFRVTHGPIPQYVPRAPRVPIPIIELTEEVNREWLELLIRKTLYKEKEYIQEFVNRHIIPIHPFNVNFTPIKARQIRNMVANILIEASNEPDPGDAEIEVEHAWNDFYPDVSDDPSSNESGSDKMGLDIDTLEEEEIYYQDSEMETFRSEHPPWVQYDVEMDPFRIAPRRGQVPFNPDNSYDGGSKRRRRVKSTNKRSKRRGKSTKKRSKKRVGKSRKRQRRHK
jgi:hypothetical protein